MLFRRSISTAVVAVAALFSSACLSEGGGGGGNTGGEEVEVMFAFGGDQSKAFQAAVDEWQKSAGVKIKYTEAAQSFDTLIRTRVAGNNLPDIALFPQPGLLLDFAKQGKMQDLSGVLNLDSLKSTLVPGELSAGTGTDGKVYGAPMSMNVKSLVWYPKKAFDAAGYQIPKTLAELEALTDKIRSDGKTPWCIGIESGPATGWPATDWLEDLVLRYGGPDTYDKWTKNEVKFNSDVVKQAANEFGKIAFTNGNVFGGRQGIVSNAFSTAGNPMFDNPPKCFMHRQGNFITQKGFFPDAVRQDLDNAVGVFQLPGKSAEERPVLGGGDLAGAFSKDANTKKVLEFITSDKFNGGTKEGSYISPHKTFDGSKYPDETTRKVAKLAYESTVFRFDGSDLMPGAVGAGSFWKGMVAWISGQKNLDQTLQEIDASWPK
jgi:alpha-glucoside transport system substrate-binding protein